MTEKEQTRDKCKQFHYNANKRYKEQKDKYDAHCASKANLDKSEFAKRTRPNGKR